MCDLSKVSTEKKIKGFKIVARKPKGRRYYSVAMGFKYPLDGHIPIVRRQHRISIRFVSDILSKNYKLHKENMLGRTSIFLNLEDARKEYNFHRREKMGGYILTIVYAEISIDVMEGYYTTADLIFLKVIAGRHIRFIKEVTPNV